MKKWNGPIKGKENKARFKQIMFLFCVVYNLDSERQV